jgi:hypothetical protein
VAGGDELDRALAGQVAAERARAHGSTSPWSACCSTRAPGPRGVVREAASGQRFTRSEGLGVASFRAFMQGAFSAHAADPLRVDAAALATIDSGGLAALFQVSDDNPLVGLDGRAALLRRLGRADRRAEVFGTRRVPAACSTR